MSADPSFTNRNWAVALKSLWAVVGGSCLFGFGALASTNAPVVCPTVAITTQLPTRWRAVGDDSLSNSKATRVELPQVTRAEVRSVGSNPRSIENPAEVAGTVAYWRAHPEAWPMSEVTIGKASYIRETAIQQILYGVGADASLQLGQSLVAAKLNFRTQATVPAPTISESIERADEMLQRHPPGSGASGATRAELVDLAMTLDEYNRAQARDDRRSESPDLPGIELNAAIASATGTGAGR